MRNLRSWILNLVTATATVACGSSSSDSPGTDTVPGAGDPNGGPGSPNAPVDGGGWGTNLSNFAARACTKDKWCWVEPLPHGNALAAVWASGPNDIWSVGEEGIIAHKDDEGWKGLYFDGGGKEDFSAARGLTPNDVWFVGGRDDAASIVHFDGSALTRMQNFGGARLRAVWPSGPKDVWVAGEKGVVLHYDGQGWSRPATLKPDAGETVYHAIWGSSPNDVWLGGSYLLHWNGTDWTQPLDARLSIGFKEAITRLTGTGPADVWAVLSTTVVNQRRDDRLMHWDGKTWSEVPGLHRDNQYDDLAPRGPGDVAVLTSNQLAHFDGAGWAILANPLDEAPVRALATIPGSAELAAVGRGGLCARVGTAWQVDVASAPIHDVVALSADEVYSASLRRTSKGSHTRVARFDGTSFTTSAVEDQPYEIRDVRLRASRSDNLWFAAFGDRVPDSSGAYYRGRFARFDGTSWQRKPDQGFSSAPVRDMWTFGPDDTWIVGGDDVLRFHGGAWTSDTDWPNTRFGDTTSIWASAPDDLWVATDRGFQGCARWGGDSWMGMYTSSNNVPCGGKVWGAGPSDIWFLTPVPTHHVGTNATNLPLPDDALASWIFGTSPSDVWVGARGVVHHRAAASWDPAEIVGAVGWSEELGGDFSPAASSVVSGDAWVAVGHGLLHHEP